MANYLKENRYDLEIKVYADYKQVFKLPYSILDIQFKSQIKNSNGELITEFTILKDTVNDQIILQLTDVQTALLENAQGLKYDVLQTDASGFDDYIFYGSINKIKTQTRK